VAIASFREYIQILDKDFIEIEPINDIEMSDMAKAVCWFILYFTSVIGYRLIHSPDPTLLPWI